MMIVYSKEYTEKYEELKRILTGEIWRFGHDRGLPFSFMNDSQTINECIGSIASRMAHLLESVILDKDQIEFAKMEEEYLRIGDKT